ncbi:MAG: CHAT domain-containing protein [Candidatus Magnetomorum sp.]|nr:CHAT domain-containing protein [Candidatus Magnetomorum sp.]
MSSRLRRIKPFVHMVVFIFIFLFCGCVYFTNSHSYNSEKEYLLNVRQLIEKGETFFAKGQFEQAVLTWEKALAEIDVRLYYEMYIKTIKKLASAYQTLGYVDQAERLFQNALPVVNQSTDYFLNTLFYCSMADFYTAFRHNEKAQQAVTQAFKQSRPSHHPQTKAIVQNNLGNLRAVKGDYDKALMAYQNSLTLINQAGDNYEIISEILLNIVRVKVYRVYGKYQRDDYKHITDAFNQAYRAICMLPDGYKKAARLVSFSLLIQDFRKELHVAMRDLESTVSLIIKGEEFYYQGHLEHAVFNWEEALFILDTEKYIGIYIDTLLNLANIYQSFGNYEKALSAYEKTMPLINKSSDRYRNARFFSNMGELYLFLENVKEGVSYLKKAVDEARQLKNPQILAQVLQKKGDGLTADRYFMGAMIAYEDSLNRIEELSQDSDIHVAALIENIRNQINQARKQLQQTIQQAMTRFQSQNRQDLPYEDYADIIIALDDINQDIQTLLDLFKQDEEQQTVKIYSQRIRKEIQTADDFLQPIAFYALTNARQIAEKIQNRRLLAHSHAALSDIYSENHRYTTAINQIRQAVFFAQENNLADILYRFQWKLARLFKKRNNPVYHDSKNAIDTYQMAIDTLNPNDPQCEYNDNDTDSPSTTKRISIYNVRKDLLNAYPTGISFEKDIKPLYVERVDVLLNQAMNLELSESERKQRVMQAIDTMENLKIAEFKDFFQDECMGKTSEPVISINATQLKQIDPSAAVIYTVFLNDRLIVILITQAGVHIYPVLATLEQIHETALQFRKEAQTPQQELYKGYAAQLYTWLIRPMIDTLKINNIKTLLIVPDGVLRLVPFAALYDGFDYLIKQYAVAYLPCITRSSPRWLSRKNATLFFGGLSQSRHDIMPRFHVETDYKAIEHAMKRLIKIDEYLDRSFSKKHVFKAFENNPYEIVHLTSYCDIGASPDDFEINAHGKTFKFEDIERLFGISQKTKPGLVIFDYSRTLPENWNATLLYSGFTIKTGAHSLLLSLWTERNIGASELVPEFYRQLIRTPYQSRAEALRSAQIEILEKIAFHHPFFWSGFVLIGDWL